MGMLSGMMGAQTMLLTEGHIFELSPQLISDVIIQGIAIFILFFFLTKVLFEPVQKVLHNRTEKIRTDIDTAKQDREEQIVAEANAEADRLIARANQEIELEKSKVSDDMRKEIVRVATAMAAKIIEQQIDESKQDALIEDTLKEMGGSTWLSR